MNLELGFRQIRRIADGAARDRHDDGEQVLRAVRQFVHDELDVLLTLLLLGDVDQHIDAADQLTALVVQQRRKGHERDQAAVRPLRKVP